MKQSEPAIRSAKIIVSWRAGYRRASRTFKVTTVDKITDVRVKVEYEISASKTVELPVTLDDGALSAFLKSLNKED